MKNSDRRCVVGHRTAKACWIRRLPRYSQATPGKPAPGDCFDGLGERGRGLPSDWKNDRMAHLIKLPRPKGQRDLERLLALTVMPLKELVVEAKEMVPSEGAVGSDGVVQLQGAVVPCVCNSIIDCENNGHNNENINDDTSTLRPQSLGEAGSQQPGPPKDEKLPCVSYSIIDCENNIHTEGTIDDNMSHGTRLPLGESASPRLEPSKVEDLTCVCNSIIDCGTVDHKQRKTIHTFTTMMEGIDLIRGRNPLYRALWTVQGLARAYGPDAQYC